MAGVLSAVAVANEFRTELALREASAVQVMMGTWRGVEETLAADFLHFVETHPDLANLTPGQVMRLERFQALEVQVRAQVAAFEGVAGPVISQGQIQAAQLGAQQAAEMLQALGLHVGFDALPVAATESVVALARAGRPLHALLEPMYGEATAGILRELTRGVALGRGLRDIARRMAGDGLTDGLNHLLLVTRDQYNRAHRTAALRRYEESGAVSGYVRRCARQPGRTCLACIALDGTFYALRDGFEGHPQCRCVMIPAVRGVNMQTLGSGRGWFEELPEEQQIAVMGQGRWEAWQAGELTWGRMVQRRRHPVWGTSVTPRTIAG